MQMRHKPSGTLMAFMAYKQKMAYTKDTNGIWHTLTLVIYRMISDQRKIIP